MKKALLSFGLILVSGAYALYHAMGGAATNPAVTVPPVTSSQVQPITITNTSSPAAPPPQNATETPIQTTQTATPPPSAPTPQPLSVPKGQYADGTYTGSPADAYYGTVEVQAVVSGGKLADVTFLQYPSDRSTSRYINSQAMPLLMQEAIAAQSANVSGVSGASDTSAAFRESLASALAQAKN
ncbi:MAG TPA: FMN-binding protein [Candidatus Paceibacterota bacterium]|nr:FMN-binding protein [Candidatus Paceibacterota bacterium]